ncbi:hypothetical protein KR222_001499, partial [Zaprionus bogoriensis]
VMEFCPNILLSLLLIQFFPYQGFGFKFTIVHNNDMHARYEPVKGSSGKCFKEDDDMGLCFGGFARIATVVQNIRAEGPALYLNAGDTFQGTSWYTSYRGKMAAELLNMLNPDAVALGIHELDDNIEGLLPFLNTARFPVVGANIDLRNVAQLQNVKSLVPSTVITKYEQKIGIIGYLTPDTKESVAVNDIEYKNEISSINNEAKKLREEGVNIIIALGHSGYRKDQEIAKNCPDVDVVVGGLSHTFLYSGAPPDKENPEGDYPTVVFKESGRRVPVVQAFAFTKYLGKISLEFDDAGILIDFKGAPILLDQTVALDPKIKSFLDSRRSKVDELEDQVVGTSKVILNGDKLLCRKEECNLGNFIADAFVYGRVVENQGGLYWTDAALAVINGGGMYVLGGSIRGYFSYLATGIRASLDPGLTGAITGADILAILPFGNTIVVARIKGRNLVSALEYASNTRHTGMDGGFLQVSGIRFVVNFNRPKGKRITSISVLCAECRIPEFQPLEMDKYYKVLVPSFLMEGGDGHQYFKDARSADNGILRMNDLQVFTKYLQEHKVVYPKLERRIMIMEKTRKSCASFQLDFSLIPIILVILPYLIF